MGKRYEKSKKNVSDNKQTLERLHTDKETLQNEYSPLSLLDSIQGLLDDEATDAIRQVERAGESTSQRLESETDSAEKEKKKIAEGINNEIEKLNAGLEKLRRANGLEFGKKAVEQSSQEYKKQIDKFKSLMGELGEHVSDGGNSSVGDAVYAAETYSDNVMEQPKESGSMHDNKFSSVQASFSGLSNTTFSKMNPDRIRVADLAFSRAPQNIIDELNAHSDHLQPTMDTGYSFNDVGQRVKDGCYYSPSDHQVRMDETLSDEEYGEILPHELSHFLDHERGWESRSSAFVGAVQADFDSMDKSTPEGRARMNEMLDDAFSTGAAFDRNVSDIMSAVFTNDPEIVQRFYMEGVPYYRHSDDYWAEPFSREAEIYANNGAVRCSDERISKNFLERYFPNTYNAYGQFYNLN